MYADEYGFHQGVVFFLLDSCPVTASHVARMQATPSRADTSLARTLLAFNSLYKGIMLWCIPHSFLTNEHHSGFNFGYSAWINEKFLGSNQGTNQYSADGGQDLTNDTWAFNPADLNTGDNVVTVVVDPTGMCGPALPDIA